MSPEVEAAALRRRVRGRRHHRRELLGEEHVVVTRHPGPLPRQVLDEQLQLIAERTMQLAPRRYARGSDSIAALELRLASGADGECDRRAQQRRPARRLQVGQQVARFLGALVAQVRDSLLAHGLGASDLIGVLDLAARDPHRQARWAGSAR